MTAVPVRVVLPGALAGAVPLAGGAAVALATFSSPKLALAAIGAIALLIFLVASPWASLPVILLGGAAADRAVATTTPGVTGVVALRGVLVAIACAAIASRRFRADDWGPRVRTPADGPAIVLTCLLAALALWGLAVDNSPHQVLVGANHLMVLPVYFFLATFTLNTPERFWAAARLFLVGAVVYAIVVHIGTAPRQGGLFSSLVVVGLLAVAGSRRAKSAERFGLALLGAIFAADIFLSGYRSVWLACGIALAMLVVLSPPSRRGLLALLAVLLAVTIATLALDSGLVTSRADAALSHAGDSSGYRNSESGFGLSMVAASPLLGHGLGRTDPDRFVETFGYKDVGPVLHDFYLTVLVNAGLVGLVLVLLLLCTALKPRAAASRDGPLASLALGTRCLLVGWAVAAIFAAPTDGHWELGLLAAVPLILDSFRNESRDAV
jgi:O-Antigen ligase